MLLLNVITFVNSGYSEHLHEYIYIYIYRERERERQPWPITTNRQTNKQTAHGTPNKTYRKISALRPTVVTIVLGYFLLLPFEYRTVIFFLAPRETEAVTPAR